MLNAQYCGLDSIDQVIVNKYIYDIESSQLHQTAGYESYLNDSIVVDTSGYIVPNSEGPAQYAFGTVINGLSSIAYTSNCSSQSNKAPLVLSDDIQIYPNPTNQYLTFKYQIGLKDNARVTIFNLDGKLVFEKSLASDINQETISIQSLATGMYIYKYEVNNKVTTTGKITKM